MKLKLIQGICAVVFGLLSTGVANATSQEDRIAEQDDRIEDAAKKTYVFKTYLSNDDVDIDSNHGVVTLTGTVAYEANKQLAGETVASLPSVKKVVNNLRVAGEPADRTSDSWIGTKVKGALLFHSNVSAVDTEVDVKDGVVTLRGRADSRAQKELTTEYARDIEGVKSVNNQMQIASAQEKTRKSSDGSMNEKIDDASVTAQVKTMLMSHQSTSALRTNVDTKNGVVTIGGTARNAAEKDLVTKRASDIQGVKRVINRMQVQSRS